MLKIIHYKTKTLGNYFFISLLGGLLGFFFSKTLDLEYIKPSSPLIFISEFKLPCPKALNSTYAWSSRGSRGGGRAIKKVGDWKGTEVLESEYEVWGYKKPTPSSPTERFVVDFLKGSKVYKVRYINIKKESLLKPTHILEKDLNLRSTKVVSQLNTHWNNNPGNIIRASLLSLNVIKREETLLINKESSTLFELLKSHSYPRKFLQSWIPWESSFLKSLRIEKEGGHIEDSNDLLKHMEQKDLCKGKLIPLFQDLSKLKPEQVISQNLSSEDFERYRLLMEEARWRHTIFHTDLLILDEVLSAMRKEGPIKWNKASLEDVLLGLFKASRRRPSGPFRILCKLVSGDPKFRYRGDKLLNKWGLGDYLYEGVRVRRPEEDQTEEDQTN